LPNFSRPSVVKEEWLRCTILGPRRTVSGVLITGFEMAAFETRDLGSGPTWHTCNQITGCDPRVQEMLKQRIPGLCGLGMARITTEGWATVTPGGYGHMNMSVREFFEDRVLTVAPPPPDLVRDWQQSMEKTGLSGDDCYR
jgi:hypothetical protein